MRILLSVQTAGCGKKLLPPRGIRHPFMRLRAAGWALMTHCLIAVMAINASPRQPLVANEAEMVLITLAAPANPENAPERGVAAAVTSGTAEPQTAAPALRQERAMKNVRAAKALTTSAPKQDGAEKKEQPASRQAARMAQGQPASARPVAGFAQGAESKEQRAESSGKSSAGENHLRTSAGSTPPVYQTNPPPAYPQLARRRGLEGTVELDVLVNRLGRAAEIRLAASSGHPLLDRAAVKAVGTWRFLPGAREQEKIDMWVRIPVRYALQE